MGWRIGFLGALVGTHILWVIGNIEGLIIGSLVYAASVFTNEYWENKHGRDN